ncbi:MAG: HAD family hydrolase [Anaerolineales bacterium]|nr:MAG: HAD family hydrolase [Anaerolineales bacterium]
MTNETFNSATVKAIFLDVDGTLRDTDDHYASLFARGLRPLGSERANRLARRMVMRLEKPGNDALGLLDALGLDGPIGRLMEAAAARRPPRLLDPHLIAGIPAAVEALAARYPLAVITVRGASATHAFLQASGLAAHIPLVVHGLSTRRTKPAAEPVLHACTHYGVQAAECVMVGDTTVDVLAAKRAGAQAIGVLSGFGEEDELRLAGADLILPSVAELPAVFGL